MKGGLNGLLRRMLLMLYKALAETAGVFMIVFAGYGSILLSERFPSAVPGFSVPIVFGSTVCLMIFAVGAVSGAHFNPAVTLAFFAAKRFPAGHIIVYWLSQFAGGLLAVGLLAILKR